MRATLTRPADRRAAWILAGIALGQFVVVPIVDRLLGGPGPFALFGL